MSNLAILRKKEIKNSAKYSNKIRKRLTGLKIPLLKKIEGLPTDLADIREVCKNYLNSLEMLFSPKIQKDKKILSEIFENIQNDLYIHLNYHLKELKNPLNILIKEIEKDGMRKGKLARQKKG